MNRSMDKSDYVIIYEKESQSAIKSSFAIKRSTIHVSPFNSRRAAEGELREIKKEAGIINGRVLSMEDYNE